MYLAFIIYAISQVNAIIQNQKLRSLMPYFDLISRFKNFVAPQKLRMRNLVTYRKIFIANEPAERRREAGEAAAL